MLEVLISILVVTIGVLASYSVVQQIFAMTFISSSRLTAAYLAEEGMEVVRNIRDTAWVADVEWNNNGLLTQTYQASSQGYSLSSCAGCGYDELSFLKSDGSLGFNYSTGTDTKFKRRITLDRSGDSITVSVDVMWRERGVLHTVNVQGYIYNWL